MIKDAKTGPVKEDIVEAVLESKIRSSCSGPSARKPNPRT
jgi:hypothetical protein